LTTVNHIIIITISSVSPALTTRTQSVAVLRSKTSPRHATAYEYVRLKHEQLTSPSGTVVLIWTSSTNLKSWRVKQERSSGTRRRKDSVSCSVHDQL